MISSVVKASEFIKLSFNWSIFNLSVAIINNLNTNIIKNNNMAAKTNCCRYIVECGLLNNSSFGDFIDIPVALVLRQFWGNSKSQPECVINSNHIPPSS